MYVCILGIFTSVSVLVCVLTYPSSAGQKHGEAANVEMANPRLVEISHALLTRRSKLMQRDAGKSSQADPFANALKLLLRIPLTIWAGKSSCYGYVRVGLRYQHSIALLISTHRCCATRNTPVCRTRACRVTIRDLYVAMN